jgi:hypothetical protein
MQEHNERRQKGQSIIIVAVALLALIVFAAIAVDISNTYVHRRTAQNAADAAALAGARDLARQLNEYGDDQPWLYSEYEIMEEMNDFAERNGAGDTDGVPGNWNNGNVEGWYLAQDGSRVQEAVIGSTGVVHPDARGIEAAAHSLAPTFFGSVLGYDGLPVQAESAVIFEGACRDSCVMPIATYTETFDYDECYNIYDGAEPGSFGWLNWQFQKGSDTCKCSAVCLGANLDPILCNSGTIEVGDWVASDSGISNSSAIRELLEMYIDTDTPFTVIVYDITQCMGGKCDECASKQNGSDRGLGYHVVGFAKFQLKGYALSSGGGGGSSYGWDGINPPSQVCLGPEPTGGNRLTGIFMGWVEGEGGECDPYGTIIAPRVIK